MARVTLIVLVPLYVANHLLISVQFMPRDASIFVRPEPYPRYPLATTVVDEHTFYFPIPTDRCWYAPLPCMPVLNEGLQMRGATLGEGFRIAREPAGWARMGTDRRLSRSFGE